MALSNHKRDTFKRFDKLKILEHDLALSSEKNLKIKLVRPLRNLKKQKFDFNTNIFTYLPMSWWLSWYNAECIFCWQMWACVQIPLPCFL